MNQWYYLNEQGLRFGPISETELSSLCQTGTIHLDTPVWNEGLPTWQPLRSSAAGGGIVANQPPPAPSHLIPRLWICLLAVAPIWGAFLGAFLVGFFRNGNLDFTMIAINFFLVYLDSRALKRRGYPVERMGSQWLIPMYLWKRARILKHSTAYFWLWCVSFVVSIYYTVA